jgi:hypothetical protein
MNKGKSVTRWIVLLVALVLVILAGHYFETRGVRVSVTNGTGSTLKHLGIIYQGGVSQIAELEPTRSCARYINPAGASYLILEWVDSLGAKHSHSLRVYINTNYIGSVDVTVVPGNTVSKKKEKVNTNALDVALDSVGDAHDAMGMWFFVVAGALGGTVTICIWTLAFRKHARRIPDADDSCGT